MASDFVEKTKKEIGLRLKTIREALNLTQEEVAEKLGIGQTGYSNYETGQRVPKLPIAIKITEIYDITLDWLFQGKMSGLPYATAELLRKHEKTLSDRISSLKEKA